MAINPDFKIFFNHFDADNQKYASNRSNRTVKALFQQLLDNNPSVTVGDLKNKFFGEIDRLEKTNWRQGGINSYAAEQAKRVFNDIFQTDNADGKEEDEDQVGLLTQIVADKHPRYPGREVTIPIGRIDGIEFKEENLGKLLHMVNENTVNKPYPLLQNSREIEGKMVHRPNHNHTHLTRVERHFSEFISFLNKKGSQEVKDTLSQLTEDTKLNCRLGAYFLRAGRVDESGWRTGDNYAGRSALIYEAYTKQLGVDEELIQQVKKMMTQACWPHARRDEDIKEDPLSTLICDAYSFAHQADLIRCSKLTEIEGEIKDSMETRLKAYVDQEHQGNIEKYFYQWMEFSKQLCKATGLTHCYGGTRDSKKFAECSTDGKYCWEQVQAVPAPVWI